MKGTKDKDGSFSHVIMAFSCVCLSASIAFRSSSRIAVVCGSLILIGGATLLMGLLLARRRKR
jgi:hypothetical protein